MRILVTSASGANSVTVNIVRPGPVDTAMPAWILAQPPAQIGAGLHDRFVAMRDAGHMASPDQPARMIADLVTGDTTGRDQSSAHAWLRLRSRRTRSRPATPLSAEHRGRHGRYDQAQAVTPPSVRDCLNFPNEPWYLPPVMRSVVPAWAWQPAAGQKARSRADARHCGSVRSLCGRRRQRGSRRQRSWRRPKPGR